jgi:hypothetical protein
MNATGTKMAISDIVVASTGQPDFPCRFNGRLHRRHPLFLDEPVDVLEHHDRIVDHDADRERQREHREHVEREAHVPDQAKGRDDRRRDRDSGDYRGAQFAEKQQHDERREDRADDEVLLDAVDRGFDEFGLIADDSQLVAGGEHARSCARRAFTPLTISTVFVPDCLRICSSTVGTPLTLATVCASASPSSMRATSRTSTGCPPILAMTMSPNPRRFDAAAGAHRDGLCALSMPAPGNVGVLRLQRARHVVDRQVWRLQARASSQTLICRLRPPSTSTCRRRRRFRAGGGAPCPRTR